jgi:hypothetical protein
MTRATALLLAATLCACGSSKNEPPSAGSGSAAPPAAPAPPKDMPYTAPLPELGELGAECADDAACTRRCDAKISAACRELADLRQLSPFNAKACELGDGDGCASSANGDPKTLARQFELDSASCEAREAAACDRLADYHLATDEGGRPNADPALAPVLREKACRLGSDTACAKLPAARQQELADVILGVSLARCARGYAASCYDAIRSAGPREAAITARIRAEVTAGCERGVSGTCWTGADLAEKTGDTKEADRLHRRSLDLGVAACEAGAWNTCWVTARAMAPEALFADNVPPINQRNADPVRAKALWLKICEGELKHPHGDAGARDRACEQAKALGADVSKIWTPPKP